jgi:hypothetical protein
MATDSHFGPLVYPVFNTNPTNNVLSGHPNPAKRVVTPKPAMSEARDIDSDESFYRLGRHEQCLERRKEAASHRPGEARMAFTAVPRQSSKRVLNQQHRESDVTMLHAMRLGEITIRQPSR